MTTSLHFHDDVREALRAGRPVVALESTIITHGMPWPDNVDTARQVEAAVREAGAVPATIAVLDGRVTVGLDEAQLDALAQTQAVMKLSRADFGVAIARGVTGSTTVAATMIVARLAGIDVFATGGIGGVHRGAEHSFDQSADLQELGRTAVSVVSAGAKAILDLPKTLEVLETLGVPVITVGQDNLPAFWSRDSGLVAPLRMDSTREIVDFLVVRERFALGGGVLIAQPVPAGDEIPKVEMDGFIEQALSDAETQGIVGKAVTPWLLTRIVELSDGRSLATNRSLILNNARFAGQLAMMLTESRAAGGSSTDAPRLS